MKQIKALLIKEWRTHRVTLLAPTIFTVGSYLIGILGIIIALIKGEELSAIVSFGKIPPQYASIMLYGTVYALSVFVGVIGIVAAIILADSLINGGFKRKCEILHLSQPVSVIKIMLSKYAFIMKGLFIQLAVLTFINGLVVYLFQSYVMPTDIYYFVTAWAQALLEVCFSLLFVGSMFWFFAALFKRKSFFMGLLLIFGIQAAISILNYTSGLHIPSLLGYIAQMASIRVDSSMELLNYSTIFTVISAKWSYLFSWHTLLKILYSAIFFVAGSTLYLKRELS
ncbi:MAG: hypothetical protein KBB33_08850 [Candidatus Cloacimonetes bacterium]|nr:hypothetical protein [Candidatus Cloacimonadota bacterium]